MSEKPTNPMYCKFERVLGTLAKASPPKPPEPRGEQSQVPKK